MIYQNRNQSVSVSNRADHCECLEVIIVEKNLWFPATHSAIGRFQDVEFFAIKHISLNLIALAGPIP